MPRVNLRPATSVPRRRPFNVYSAHIYLYPSLGHPFCIAFANLIHLNGFFWFDWNSETECRRQQRSVAVISIVAASFSIILIRIIMNVLLHLHYFIIGKPSHTNFNQSHWINIRAIPRTICLLLLFCTFLLFILSLRNIWIYVRMTEAILIVLTIIYRTNVWYLEMGGGWMCAR